MNRHATPMPLCVLEDTDVHTVLVSARDGTLLLHVLTVPCTYRCTNVLMCDGLRVKVLVLTTPSHAPTHHRQRASMQPTAPVAALVRRTRGWTGYRSTVPRRCCNQSHRWAPGKTWTSVRCQRMRCDTLFSSICDAVLKTYDPWVCTRLSSGAWVKI